MTHFSHSKPTAHKRHRCHDCGRIIQPGEQYRRGSGMDGSTAWTWKECAHCVVLASHVSRLYDLDEYGPANLHDWDPETLEQLRIKVQFRKRWTRADGTLYPVPWLEWLHKGDSPWPYAVRLHIGPQEVENVG